MNKILTLAIIGILLFSCSSTGQISTNNLDEKSPFKVMKSSYEKWVGGQPGVKGVMVNIEIDNPKILLDSVYFRNMKAPLSKSKSSPKETYIGHFTYPNNSNDIILDIDATKEFGNQVPDISKKIPFDLEQDEAVVSYHFKGLTKYFKISNITEDPLKMN